MKETEKDVEVDVDLEKELYCNLQTDYCPAPVVWLARGRCSDCGVRTWLACSEHAMRFQDAYSSAGAAFHKACGKESKIVDVVFTRV